MEKFSAYRDPGTGIQPFLTPVSPLGSELLVQFLFPVGLMVGVIRTLLVLALGFIYISFVKGALFVLKPVPPLHRIATFVFTSLIARLVLLLVGLWWIPVDLVTRKRGGVKAPEKWSPKAGDVIVSNWASWIEILWLAFRFNPIFVLPVCEAIETPLMDSSSSLSITHTPGRRSGTGSANISSSTRALSARKQILGFRQVTLFAMLRSTGKVPPYDVTPPEQSSSLDDIRRNADGPIVVFPECTTSNGRGMLRFADVFRGETMPIKKYRMFIMCVRYDPPTSLAPTLTQSIPSPSLNPFPHLFTIATSLLAPHISIRLLAPSESPSSGPFGVSDVVSNFSGDDHLTEACGSLIAQIGKMKRTGMGWEDKAAFLDFYQGKRI